MPTLTPTHADAKRKQRDEDLLLALALWEAGTQEAYSGLPEQRDWTYNPQTQQYVSDSGTTLRSVAVGNLVDSFATAVELEIESVTKDLLADLADAGHLLPGTAEAKVDTKPPIDLPTGLEPTPEDAIIDRVGKMSVEAAELLDRWRDWAIQFLRMELLAAAAVGAGGVDNLTDKDYETIEGVAGDDKHPGSGMADIIARLEKFRDAMADGSVTYKQAVARAGSYASQGYIIYTGVKRNAFERAFAGLNVKLEERSLLEPAAEHCHDSLFTPGCIEEAKRGWVPLGKLTALGFRTCGVRDRCHWEGRAVPVVPKQVSPAS